MPRGVQPRPSLHEVAREIEQLAERTPKEVVKHLQERLEEKRKAMPRGASGEVLTSCAGS